MSAGHGLDRADEVYGPRSNDVDGWVSLEVSPLLAHNTPSTVEEPRLCESQYY
jgi:transaldolase